MKENELKAIKKALFDRKAEILETALISSEQFVSAIDEDGIVYKKSIKEAFSFTSKQIVNFIKLTIKVNFGKQEVKDDLLEAIKEEAEKEVNVIEVLRLAYFIAKDKEDAEELKIKREKALEKAREIKALARAQVLTEKAIEEVKAEEKDKTIEDILLG